MIRVFWIEYAKQMMLVIVLFSMKILAAAQTEPLVAVVRIGGLDRCHLKRRICVTRHRH